MTRLPVISTIIVALACATMVGLGVWQLDRANVRDHQNAIYARNSRNAAPVAFPELPPVADTLLYRRSSVTCLEVTGWEPSGGTAADGARGFRFIASCRTGAEGPGVLVDMGVSTDPAFRPSWTGGPISGRITLAPQASGMIARLLLSTPPPSPLLVADRAAPGLMVSAAPDPTTQPNSSWAYAFQWFLFAVAAAVIYGLALRWRTRAPAAPVVAAKGEGAVAPSAAPVAPSTASPTAADSANCSSDGGSDGGSGCD